MNIFEIIKRIFEKNNNMTKNISNKISTVDVSDIFIPGIDELNQLDKEKVLKYQNSIDIENLNSLITYNQEIVKEGEIISKLLIKFLYELESITRKDNKTEKELNEEYIDLAIKNTKLIVLKKELKKLLDDSILRVVAILEFSKKDKKRIYEFLGMFSNAKRIKRNMQERSLEEATIRSKLVVKTLILEYQMVLNSLNTNNNLLDSLYIYNNLKDKVNHKFERKEVYILKLIYLEKANTLLNLDLLNKLEKINFLLKNFNEENEIEIIFKMAIVETEIDKFVYSNKDKLMSTYKESVEELKNINITLELKEELLDKIEKLETMSTILKDFISDNDLKDLYRIKFKVLTIDINTIEGGSHIKKYNKKEFECYKEIVSEKISNILTGNSEGVIFYKNSGELKNLIKILNSLFKINRYYDYEKILNNSYLLGLLLSFDKEDGLREFYDNYKFNHEQCHKFVNLHEDIDFNWESELSIDTICQLIDSEVEFDGREEAPSFYDLYKLRKKYFYDDSTYKLPEGLCKVGYKFGLYKLYKTSNSYNLHYNNNAFINYIRKNASGKNVILPSTLKEINFPLFYYKEIRINSLVLNDGLKYVCDNCFHMQNIKNIIIPSSLEKIGEDSFNFNYAKVLEFRDFKNNILLKKILYSDEKWVRKIIGYILLSNSLDFINLCCENNDIVYSINCYKLQEDAKTLQEMFRIQRIVSQDKNLPQYVDEIECLKNVLNYQIEKKTGYKIEPYEAVVDKINKK